MNDKVSLPFFVYGTLLPGQPNYHLWNEVIESQEAAVFTNGRLYDMGYYPMLVAAEGERVHGNLVRVKPRAYRQIMERLDALEGFDPADPSVSPYRRRARQVVLADGRRVEAWVYVGREWDIEDAIRIQGGDWTEYVKEQMGPIMTWWRDVTTVWGIHGVER